MSAAKAVVAAHRRRRVDGRVLIVNDAGNSALLTDAEYDGLLSGAIDGHPRRAELESGGFLGAGAAGAFGGPLGWKGPSLHVLQVDRDGTVMTLETARAAVDFLFCSPGASRAELIVEDANAAWPVAWFLIQYGRRRGEWGKREFSICLRTESPLDSGRLGFLQSEVVELATRVNVGSTPPPATPSAARRALASVAANAAEPELWARWFADSGFARVRLDPVNGPAPSAREARLFADFYERFLAALDGFSSVREEWDDAFARRDGWSLPGNDVVSELAYDPEGRVYTGEAAMRTARGGKSLLEVGRLGALKYEELSSNPAVRAALLSAFADHQPLCSQCVYNSSCVLPAAESLRAQGTTWGQTPSSAACALRLSVLDRRFASARSRTRA